MNDVDPALIRQMDEFVGWLKGSPLVASQVLRAFQAFRLSYSSITVEGLTTSRDACGLIYSIALEAGFLHLASYFYGAYEENCLLLLQYVS